MSDFVRAFLDPASELENLSRQFVGSQWPHDRTDLRRRIETYRQTLIRLRDRALEHGVPMPPTGILFGLPPGLKNWEEWEWDFRRAITDFVSACERMAESVYTLAPEPPADRGDDQQIRAWAEGQNRALQGLDDHRPALEDARTRLWRKGEEVRSFQSSQTAPSSLLAPADSSSQASMCVPSDAAIPDDVLARSRALQQSMLERRQAESKQREQQKERRDRCEAAARSLERVVVEIGGAVQRSQWEKSEPVSFGAYAPEAGRCIADICQSLRDPELAAVWRRVDHASNRMSYQRDYEDPEAVRLAYDFAVRTIDRGLSGDVPQSDVLNMLADPILRGAMSWIIILARGVAGLQRIELQGDAPSLQSLLGPEDLQDVAQANAPVNDSQTNIGRSLAEVGKQYVKVAQASEKLLDELAQRLPGWFPGANRHAVFLDFFAREYGWTAKEYARLTDFQIGMYIETALKRNAARSIPDAAGQASRERGGQSTSPPSLYFDPVLYCDDEGVKEAYYSAQDCVQSARLVFSSIASNGPWEIVAGMVNHLIKAAQDAEYQIETMYDQFAECGLLCKVGPVEETSGHAAALALAKWVLDEIWTAVTDPERWFDKFDAKAIAVNYSSVVKHFAGLPPPATSELETLLKQEAVLVMRARRVAKVPQQPLFERTETPSDAESQGGESVQKSVSDSLTAEERCIQIYLRDPNQSLRKIARLARCDPSIPSRSDKLRRLREAHAGKLPRGRKTKEGDLEAEDE
jgi:hypothetical protein